MDPTEIEEDRKKSEVADRTADTHKKVMGMIADLAATTEASAIEAGARALRAVLIDHFREEEAPGGLFGEMEAMRPGFRRRITSLRAQHRQALGLVEWVAEKAADKSCELAFLHNERDDLVQLLRRHESVESRLMTDAFYIDLGCGD